MNFAFDAANACKRRGSHLMKKVPHYIMRIASRALAMMDGNILRKWKSCWMQACTAGAVLLIAPLAFAALSVSIACNDFESTGTSSCNYFLDGTAAELADIERVEVSAKDSVSGWKILVTYHKNSYRILDDAKPRSSAYFAPDAAGALPLKFVITSKAGSSTTITPTSHVMRRGTMPLLPIEFTGMQLPSAGPQWSADANAGATLTQKLHIERVPTERTFWAAQYALKGGKAAGYIGAQVSTPTEHHGVFSIWGAEAVANDPESKANCLYNAHMEGSTQGVSCIRAVTGNNLPFRTNVDVELKVTRLDRPPTAIVRPDKHNGTPVGKPATDFIWFRGEVGGLYVATIGVPGAEGADFRPVVTSNFIETYNFLLPKEHSIVTFYPPSSAKSDARPVTTAYLYDTGGIPYARKQGATVAGPSLKSDPNVASEAICERICANNANCAGYAYAAVKKTCEQKSDTTFSHAGAQPDGVAGIKLQHTFAFRENSYSAGKVVRTISDVGSVPECQLSCEQDAACKSFTYLARDRKCELKDGQGYTDVRAETRWYSGDKQ
jgi:hypothetical protein